MIVKGPGDVWGGDGGVSVEAPGLSCRLGIRTCGTIKNPEW